MNLSIFIDIIKHMILFHASVGRTLKVSQAPSMHTRVIMKCDLIHLIKLINSESIRFQFVTHTVQTYKHGSSRICMYGKRMCISFGIQKTIDSHRTIKIELSYDSSIDTVRLLHISIQTQSE